MPIATYETEPFGFFDDASPATLTISEEGVHMIDMILITWTFARSLVKSRRSNSHLWCAVCTKNSLRARSSPQVAHFLKNYLFSPL